MKTIYEYDDYQKFLYDFYEEKKQATHYFTFRYMADHTGVDAGFLSKVCNGKEHLSLKSVEAVGTFCKLSPEEIEFFMLLVRFGRATVPAEIKAYYEEILAMRGIDMRRVSDQYYAFYQKWYHTAIRAILSFYRCNGNVTDLAKMLSPEITPAQAQESLELLVTMGFIQIGEDGYYELVDKHISTGAQWQTAAIHRFQEETIDLARNSLKIHDKSLRDISSVTLSVHHDDLAEIRARAQEFRRSLMQMETGNGESDSVYQVNIQVIPMSVRK